MGDEDTPLRVEPIELEQEVKRSFLDYAMSVIVSRALPDVRDGLKPVHRRILFDMQEQGMTPDRPHSKSAGVVGDVIKWYHPHGDAAVYDAMARLAQDFAMRYTLVDGHGNFGSVDGDPPAAYRYTEARLSRLATELLRDINEETVDFSPNFDNRKQEPVVLPSRYPNLLVNGSTGIAVGMATNIPPHNLGEVVDAVDHVLNNPDATPQDLMAFVKGPDFPTGAIIMGHEGIRSAYLTGRGAIRMRARAEIEEHKGRQRVIVSELPYMVSGDVVLRRIGELVTSKRLNGISDLKNESSRKGIRLVISLKRDAIPQVVLNNLYKQTQLQDTFGVIMLALVDGVPRTLNLAQVIGEYVRHQVDVVVRRTTFRLKRAEERAHVLEGLLIALKHLDDVIQLIRESASAEDARGELMRRFELTEIQATAILDMQLRRLAALERKKVQDEHGALKKAIKELKMILGDPGKVRDIIREELGEIRRRFSDERRTEIQPDVGDLEVMDLIADDDVVITVTRSGYIKRIRATAYRAQGRGGKGIIGTKPKEGDIVAQLLTTSNHAYVLFFTNRGKVYRLRAHEVPEKERTARGTSIRNLLPLTPDEEVAAVVDTRDYESHKYLLIGTRKGIVKKTEFRAYDSSRRDGIIALALRPNDEVVQVRATSGEDELVIVTRKGQAIRFDERGCRPMGRSASGVMGIRLRKDDEVCAIEVVDPNGELLVVTDAGYGKRTRISLYPQQLRGGIGVLTAKLTSARGEVRGAAVVRPGHEIFLIATDGQVIRMKVSGISRQSRSTTGVRIMRLVRGTQLAAMALTVEE